MITARPNNVDEYIAGFPEEIRVRLGQIREAIVNAAPAAEEKISYGIPAYTLNGPLVYFAAYKNHIGLYATPAGNAAFKEELAGYKTSKGTVQFPHKEPLPLDLITKIVVFRVAENLNKTKTR